MKQEIHQSISSQREQEQERERDVNDGGIGEIGEEVACTSSSTTMLSFQDGITTVLIETEELRRRIHSISSLSLSSSSSSSLSSSSLSSRCVTNEDCFQILHDLEELLARLYSPQLTIDDEINNSCNNDSSSSSSRSSSSSNNNKSKNEIEIEIELRKHCLQKTKYVAMLALKLITTTTNTNTNTTHMSSSSQKNRRQQGKQEPDPEDDNYRADEERDCQSAIARIAELNLVLCCDNCGDDDNDVEDKTEGTTTATTTTTKKSVDEIINVYSSYQRQVIRQRSKPSIARLVEHRKRHKQMMEITFRNDGVNEQQVVVNNDDNEDGDEDDDRNYDSSSSKQHIKVLTTILGQATSLIHPLMMWGSNLPQSSALYKLCTQSIQTLDEQAQSLANTVATWFMEDSKIDSYWMIQMSGRGESNNYNNQGYYSSSDRTTTDIDLGELDSVVDQLAFCCQIFDRYTQLVVLKHNETTRMTILQQLHPEWTWKYASLERYLTTQQLRSALHPSNNFPVDIVVGAKIQVPSFVEDGTYLSTRALKRAASTRSDQAIGTVAHSIASDVWSTDTDNNNNNNNNNAGTNNNGIYEALVEQRGCYNPTNNTNNEVLSSRGANNKKTNYNSNDCIDNNTPKGSSTSSNSNSFAQALLGALDEDPSSSTKPTASIVKSISSPNSGGLLGTISSFGSVGGGDDKFLQIRLATHICALNGIHSASIACSSLVEFLDSLLIPDDDHDDNPKKDGGGGNSMVHLAREELYRYSKNYQDLLQTQIVKIVTEFCGSLKDDDVPYGRNNYTNVIPVLRYNLERESYNLPNAQYLANAEEDTRLYKILIQPINDCQLFNQFDKCDAAVLRLLGQEMARVLCGLFLNILLPITPTSSTTTTTNNNPKKKMFTDWGSLLFSKEVRLIQNHLEALIQQAVSTAAIFSQQDDQAHSSILMSQQWERLSQAVTILQLEKPSDWLSYNTYHQSQSQPASTGTVTSVLLSTQELHGILSLRVDFSREAVDRVVASIIDK